MSEFQKALDAEMQGALNDYRAAMIRAQEIWPLPPVERTWRTRLRTWWYWKQHDARRALAKRLYDFED